MRRGWLLGASILILACTRKGAEQPAPQPRAEAAGKTEAEDELPATSTAAASDPNGESGEPSETGGEPALAPVDGFFMAAGAPSPRACTVASDCLGDTIPDLDQPCCQNPRSLEPYARDYKRWLGQWRADHCEGVRCPPPPAPYLPPDCAFEVECVEGICVDTCP